MDGKLLSPPHTKQSDRSYDPEPSRVARPVARLDTAYYSLKRDFIVVSTILNYDWLKVAFSLRPVVKFRNVKFTRPGLISSLTV